MTTRKQRERLIRLEDVSTVFADEACLAIWDEAYRQRVGAMPMDFPHALRLRVRCYLEMAQRPSRGEVNSAAVELHCRLYRAILYKNPDAATEALEAGAGALEEVPQPIRDELDRLTPDGIPTPAQLRDPQQGIEKARELLGCCVRGGEIVPGRKRPGGRNSRPKIRLLPRFKQGRGFPRQEAEALLVRSLAEYWRGFNNGGFPRSWARDLSKPQSPFERLVVGALRRCGVSGVDALGLVRRILNDIRDAEGWQRIGPG
jgi:hypothetical protein